MNHMLMLIANDFEDVEVRCPLERLFEEGYNVTLAGPQARQLYFGHRRTETMLSNVALGDVDCDSYQVLLLPGGPAVHTLRAQAAAAEIVRHFCKRGKAVAAISSGVTLLSLVGALRGRAVASAGKLAAEVREAGGCPVDLPLVHDGPLTTARGVDDIEPFVNAVLLRAGERLPGRQLSAIGSPRHPSVPRRQA